MVKIFFLVLSLVVIATSTPVKQKSAVFGKNFQGDIKLTALQRKLIFGEAVDPNTGIISPVGHWPTNLQGHVIVPYRIQSSEGFSQDEIDWLLRDMRLVESQTCVRFVEYTNQIDFVEIINSDGCWSWLGRIGGRQELSMDSPGCFWGGTAAHEYMHALGFDHMHNDIRRDDFIDIHIDNVDPDFRFAFDKVDPQWFSHFDTPYDLRSVVHYPRWAFSTNGEDVIIPHDRSYIDIIGNGQLSDGDVVRINRMHQCLNV